MFSARATKAASSWVAALSTGLTATGDFVFAQLQPRDEGKSHKRTRILTQKGGCLKVHKCQPKSSFLCNFISTLVIINALRRCFSSPRPGGASSGGGGAPMAQARGAVSRRREEEEQLADTWSHFSTFALSGNNGSVRWHHLPTDFQPKQVKCARALSG